MILLGTYNPLHEGHLNIALTALSFFEQNFKDQIELVACYLSPSQDAHIQNKAKES
jgi:nicotinic acid mononucleotide adenylyltransferase